METMEGREQRSHNVFGNVVCVGKNGRYSEKEEGNRE